MPRSHLSSVFFAGVEIDPLALRKALKLGSYSFTFNGERMELIISSNNGEIARITCAYESARKFVIKFGCKHASDECVFWSIFIPEPTLYDDGSEYAATLELALRDSGLPFKVIRGHHEFMLIIDNGRYRTVGWELKDLLQKIEEEKIKYADVIALWKT